MNLKRAKELLDWFVLGGFVFQYRSGFKVREFTSGIKGIRSAVFLLPNSEEVCKAAFAFVVEMVQKKIAVTLVVHSTCRTHFSGIHQVQFVEYFPSDIAKMGFPKRSFREKMHFTEADALLSCNFFNDIFLHICAILLKCRVKIGIKGNFTDHIYQVQLVPITKSITDSLNSLRSFCQLS